MRGGFIHVVGVLFVSILFLATPVSALVQSDPAGGDLPEGKGRETVANICVQCHPIATVTSQKRSRTEWEEIVSRMISNGAQILPDEVESIVAYLSEYFGAEPKAPDAPGAGASAGTSRKFVSCHARFGGLTV